MSTHSKNKEQKFSKQFKALFEDYSEKEQIEIDASVLHMKVMSEVERKMVDKNWKKKDLAKAVGTSASYITQLFRGDRMVNLEMIAKFQRTFGGEFTIKWCDKGERIHVWTLKNRQSFVMPELTIENDIEAGAVLAA